MQWQDFLFSLLSPLLLCRRTGNQLCSLSISGKTDKKLSKLISSAPILQSAKYSLSYTSEPEFASVYTIAADAIAKGTDPYLLDQEYLSMELVRNNTCIPVPKPERRIKRRIPSSPLTYCYLVQQFIPGDPLKDVWPSLSWWKRFRVALTLRFYIHQLRSLHLTTGPPAFPGPPTIDGKPGSCHGRLFPEAGTDPFSSYHELAEWYNERRRVLERFRKKQLSIGSFDSTLPLTFTHMDLHPRIMILGHDGQLWLVDWAEAGWYPSWFEGTSMIWWTWRRSSVSPSWRRILPFIAGSSYKPGQMPFLNEIDSAVKGWFGSD